MKRQNHYLHLPLPYNHWDLGNPSPYRSSSYAYLSNCFQKCNSLIKNQINGIIKVFVFCLLMLTFSYFSYSQNNPSVRVKANEFNHDALYNTRDWILSVFEDDNGSFISAAYTQRISGGAATNHITPSLVKVDAHFEPVWQQYYTAGVIPPGTGRSFKVDGFIGSMQEAIQYEDPDDNEMYYVAVGNAKLTGLVKINGTDFSLDRMIIVKTDRFGSVVSGFPRIYMNTPGTNDTMFFDDNRHGRGIIYDKTDPGYFYVAGSQNDIPCVYRLNKDLDFNSLTVLTTLPTIGPEDLGELFSICLQYPMGSNPKGNPIGTGSDLIPSHVWATGVGRHNDILLNKYTDSAILITKIKIDGPTPFTTYSARCENSPSNPSPSQWGIGGGDWGLHASDPWYKHAKNIGKTDCSTSYRRRTGGDVGTGIRQLANGSIIVTGLVNLIYSGFSNPAFCKPSGAPYWRDADAFARLIDPSTFPTVGLNTAPGVGGYEIKAKHIGHFSGMEYTPKVRQDEYGDLYFIGSNGDPGKVKKDDSGNDLLTNFYVIKTKDDLEPIWNETYRSEEANEASCGFGVDICSTGELVVAGDNKKENDNYDFIRLGNCETSFTGYDLEATSPNSFDYVTISTLDLLDGKPGTLNFTTNQKIKGRLVIESGCIVNVKGAELQFADLDRLTYSAVNNGFDYGVVIQPGGKLQLENGSILTSLTGCEHKWRGVQVQASSTPDQTDPTTIGIMEMTDSKIENAICGVTVDGGGLITCTNTTTATNNPAGYDMVNFLNNRKGVAFYPFTTANNLSRFNFTNFSFESPAAVKDFNGIGLNTHCSMYGVDKIIFNGCTFKNTYTGPYRLGFGLASFDATFQVLKGNNGNTTECYPIGRTPEFENLTYGIISDGTPYSSPYSPANFIGVGEASFTNCGVAWQCDNEVAPLAYKNTFDWNDDLEDYPISTFGKGIRCNNTDQIKIHENTFTTNGNYNYSINGILLDNTASFPYTSLLRLNKFENASTTNNQFYRGVYSLGDNSLFELKCNQFIDMAEYDWQNYGGIQDQGNSSPGVSFDNKFTSGCPGTYTLITDASNTFEYHDYTGSIQAICFNTYVTVPPVKQPKVNCDVLDPCDVYVPGILDGFEFENIEAPAMREEGKIWGKIKEADYPSAQNLANGLEPGDYKTLFNTIIPILQAKRLSKPTHAEVEILKTIAKARKDASIDARHFLSFFLEILIPLDNDEHLIPNSAKKIIPKMIAKSNQAANQKFKIYPNPASGLLYLEVDNTETQNLTLVIMDVTGKLISQYTHIPPGSKTTIDMKSQSMGVYFYKLYSDDGYIKTGKVVISR